MCVHAYIHVCAWWLCEAQALVRVCLYIHLLIFKAGSLPDLGVTK